MVTKSFCFDTLSASHATIIRHSYLHSDTAANTRRLVSLDREEALSYWWYHARNEAKLDYSSLLDISAERGDSDGNDLPLPDM